MSFFTVTAEDLAVPQSLTFTAGKPVRMMIKDYKEIAAKEMLVVDMRVLDGEHKDCIHQMFINKKGKRDFIKFVMTFWTREQLISGQNKPSEIIGKTVEVMFSVPKEVNGKFYQNLVSIVKIDTDASKAIDNLTKTFGDGLPF